MASVALVFQALGVDGAAVAQEREDVGQLLGNATKCAGVAPIGLALFLAALMRFEGASYAGKEVLAFG